MTFLFITVGKLLGHVNTNVALPFQCNMILSYFCRLKLPGIIRKKIIKFYCCTFSKFIPFQRFLLLQIFSMSFLVLIGEETHWKSFGYWIIFPQQELNNNENNLIIDHINIFDRFLLVKFNSCTASVQG